MSGSTPIILGLQEYSWKYYTTFAGAKNTLKCSKIAWNKLQPTVALAPPDIPKVQWYPALIINPPSAYVNLNYTIELYI